MINEGQNPGFEIARVWFHLGVPESFKVDYNLCARAEKYASGHRVHKLANLLTPYLVWPQLGDPSLRDEFLESERQLRAFVAQIAIESAFEVQRQLEQSAEN